MNRVYVVYVDARTFMSPKGCEALAFVEDDNPDGFALLDQHWSSNWGWAWQDIRRPYRCEVFRRNFNGDYDIVDVNTSLVQNDHDTVIAMLQKARTKEGGAE